MASFFLVVQKSFPNAGRNLNLTYVNVVTGARSDGRTFANLILLAPWNDPQFPEFIVEITEQEFDDIQSGVIPLFSDGISSQPRFQQRVTGTGSTSELGSWSDPTDNTSTWQPNTPISDDRWILRTYDADPLTTGVQIASDQLEEGTGRKVYFLRLFNQNDVPSNTNAQNQLTIVGNIKMIFDFTAGVTTFGVPTNAPGETTFPSNHFYRQTGPAGEKEFKVEVFGRDIPVIGGS